MPALYAAVAGLSLVAEAGVPAIESHVLGLGDRLLDGDERGRDLGTIGGRVPLLEVLIFDFDRDIYGQYITVHFLHRLREERHFDDLEALKRQMHIDVAAARAALTV